MNSPEKSSSILWLRMLFILLQQKGKIFLRCSKKGILTEGKKKEIIEQLNIETGDECRKR